MKEHRVDVQTILADDAQRKELVKGAVEFLIALENGERKEMTPLPAEVEAQIEEIAPIGAAWADDNERHFHLGLMKGARSMAEFDREYWTEEVCLSCGNKDCGKQWTFASCVTAPRVARAEFNRREKERG